MHERLWEFCFPCLDGFRRNKFTLELQMYAHRAALTNINKFVSSSREFLSPTISFHCCSVGCYLLLLSTVYILFLRAEPSTFTSRSRFVAPCVWMESIKWAAREKQNRFHCFPCSTSFFIQYTHPSRASWALGCFPPHTPTQYIKKRTRRFVPSWTLPRKQISARSPWKFHSVHLKSPNPQEFWFLFISFRLWSRKKKL